MGQNGLEAESAASCSNVTGCGSTFSEAPVAWRGKSPSPIMPNSNPKTQVPTLPAVPSLPAVWLALCACHCQLMFRAECVSFRMSFDPLSGQTPSNQHKGGPLFGESRMLNQSIISHPQCSISQSFLTHTRKTMHNPFRQRALCAQPEQHIVHLVC